MTSVALVEHFSLREANQRNEATEEPVRLAQAAQFLNDPAVHDAEIAGVARNRHFRDLVDQLVAETGYHPLRQRLALARSAARGDHIEALLRFTEQGFDNLRGVPHVDIA